MEDKGMEDRGMGGGGHGWNKWPVVLIPNEDLYVTPIKKPNFQTFLMFSYSHFHIRTTMSTLVSLTHLCPVKAAQRGSSLNSLIMQLRRCSKLSVVHPLPSAAWQRLVPPV